MNELCRGLTQSEFENIKAELKGLPFRVCVRVVKKGRYMGAIHILPHKSSSPNRRWTSEQFYDVRKFVISHRLRQATSELPLHSEYAHYVLCNGLLYLMF